MPFSFSRLFLGKKATIIDEDSLPCQPREIVPVAVDANAVTSKTKFGLTKIGRALKHKFHLNTTHIVPAGHGPLMVVADEPFSPFTPFSRCLQSPATPALQSLPHIPDVSSTLRRDFRNATRFALLAAAEEANSLTSSNDIYISTPCHKRRTRSSSILGESELPRPGTPLEFEDLRPQFHGLERDGLASPVRSFLVTPVDSPVIWDNEDISAYSSEYNEVPDVLPLGFEENIPPFLPPFVGLAAIQTAFPSPAHGSYTQQYLQANANWSMPVLAASHPPSSPYGSFVELPKLPIGSRKSLPASSTYSAFPPAHSADTRTSGHDFSTPKKSQLTTYSPLKPTEQAKLFPHTTHQSPPADEPAREAHLYNTFELALVQIGDASTVSLNDDCCDSASEVFFHGAESEDQLIPCKILSRHLECLFEPRPNQPFSGSINQTLADTHEDDSKVVEAFDEETSHRETEHYGTIRATCRSAVLLHHHKENTQQFRRELLVLRRLSEYAPDAILRPGPKRRVHIVANGPSRFIPGFDICASEDKYVTIGTTGPLRSSSSSPITDNNGEAVQPHPGQVDISTPPSPSSDHFEYPFIAQAYDIAVTDAPKRADMINLPSIARAIPKAKQVTFAKVRRAITHGGTVSVEQEASHAQTESSQESPSEWPDLKDDWHKEDQDFLHIGEHVAGFKILQKDIIQENATKDAINCLQARLASANTKLMNMESLEQALNLRQDTIDGLQTSLASANTRLNNMESLERALDLRHESHVYATEQVAELSEKVSTLEARVAAGKAVFDKMMSNKLVELASKDKELETLRELCNNDPATKELADLHDALRESRADKIMYLQHAEEAFSLLKLADDRQARAEQETHTARIAQTFAEINQQSAEEYHDNLKERVAELEYQHDEAIQARDDVLAALEQLHHAHAALKSGPAEAMDSTTPMGSSSGYHKCHDEVDEYETWESGIESEDECNPPTEGVTEELEEHDWDDSEIF